LARIRTIKPGFFTNEGLSEVSEPAQILAGGLLCYADDEGYFNAHPALIKAAVFPLREPSKPVPEMLKELARIQYVRFGNGKDGRRYGHIVNFSEHQKVSHPVASKIKDLVAVWEISGNYPEVSVKATEPLRPELNGIELNGIEKEIKPSARKKAARGDSQNLRQLAKAQCETRHSRSKQLIEGFYRDWAGVDCPWDGAEGRQLSSLLKAWPGASDAEFMTCLENLATSEAIAPGTRPCEWIHKLPKFIKGPLDQYWKPKHGVNGNGNGNSKAERRNADISATTRAVFGVHREFSGDVPKALPDKVTP